MTLVVIVVVPQQMGNELMTAEKRPEEKLDRKMVNYLGRNRLFGFCVLDVTGGVALGAPRPM